LAYCSAASKILSVENMKKAILTTIAALGLGMGASAASIITQWNFNNNPPDASTSTGTLAPAVGSGSAATVGTVVTTHNPGSPTDTGADNTTWRTGGFPPQSTGNKSCGVQFNLSTVGYENITLSWDQANSAGANKYWRVQYSIDGGANWIDKDVVVNNAVTAWNTPIATVSFASISAASQNPNFAVRIVSEFESTAVGGADAYVPVNSTFTYGETHFLRLDMVTFSGDVAVGGEVNILSEPTSQVVAVGQPFAFQVIVGGGTTTITYQWRTNSIAIPEATNSVYSVAAAQHSHAGSYDVVVANAISSKTSEVATLTVRDPLSLAWTAQNGAVWDSVTESWENTTTAAIVAYTNGDHVLFDSRGSSSPWVSVVESVTPSSITVDADSDYVLRTDTGGKIAGATGLTKRGIGTLILNTDNIHSGPTVIEAGTLQVGAADDHGALGSGPISNNGAIVFNRSDNIVVPNTITGSGGITNLGKSVTLQGANTYSGPIGVFSGTLTLSGSQAVNSTEVFLFPWESGISAATRLALAGGAVVSSGTTIHMSGTTPAGDMRLALAGSGGVATINGPIILDGSWVNNIYADDTAQFVINGDISAAPDFSGAVMFRGNLGSGIVNGTINLPGIAVHKTDTSTWTFNSTSNDWATTGLAVGTMRIGADNALPPSLILTMGQASATATLDLAGFNQQIASLTEGEGNKVITNSSAISDSTLTVGSGSFGGRIADSSAGPKTGLTIDGATFTLSSATTYSGDTTVLAGTLALSGAGDVANSAVINLAGGGLDVSGRNDGTLTVGAGQTLKGNGALLITGNLINNGIVELKADKSGGVINNDFVTVTGQVTYGGTLKLSLSGQSLAPTDTIPVFSAGTYAPGNSFVAIEPAIPAPGLAWDTSTLSTDGILRLAESVSPTFSSVVLSTSGSEIIFGGSGGPVHGTFSVLASTNVAAPLANWTTVETGSFDANGNFSVTNVVTPGSTRNFFRLQVP
jgi:autotransporter-associated beta strand protein